MKKITILDTTLRDGEQGEGITFTVEDKVVIAQKLDRLGVTYIEGGWPGSNPKAVEFFDKMKNIKLKQAKLTAFGSTMRKSAKTPKDDVNLEALINSGTPAVSIFGKSWDLHVKEILKISLDQNLRLIYESIKYLKSKDKEVIYDAEHFFDGYLSNPDYALQTIKIAKDAGADIVALCDTNGGMLPQQVASVLKQVIAVFPTVNFGVHMHNDSGCAVANSLMAVDVGAGHVQGTINGFGERCGNADLCTIIPGIQLKLGKEVISAKQLQTLTVTAHSIAEIANQPLARNKPYVGYSAFAHKAGIHVDAIQKNSRSYEHLEPELIGNSRRVLISELSGKSNLLSKLASMGIALDSQDPGVKALLNQIKTLEHYGYQFEEGEASFDLLVRKQLGKYHNLFELISLHVNNDKYDQGEELLVEASLKIRVNGEIRHTVADGNGPVAALDGALRKALKKSYPEISEIQLQDYKVRVLDSKDGTNALVRVLIKSTDKKESWGTVGVSTNIIEASWQALVDSIEYKLSKR